MNETLHVPEAAMKMTERLRGVMHQSLLNTIFEPVPADGTFEEAVVGGIRITTRRYDWGTKTFYNRWVSLLEGFQPIVIEGYISMGA